MDEAGGVARQRIDDLKLFRRLGGAEAGGDEIAQGALGDAGRLDEGVETGADAAVGKGDDRGVAHLRVAAKPRRDRRRIVDEPRAAAFAVDEAEQPAGDGSNRPSCRSPSRSGSASSCARARVARQRVSASRRVAPLVLEQMPQVLVGGDAEKQSAAAEAAASWKSVR